MRWYLYAAAGAFFALIFYPLHIWQLAFVALAPLFYLSLEGRLRDVFWGGALAGAIGVAPLLYLSVGHLVMQPYGIALTYAVRASFVFITILIGLCIGAALLAYRLLRRRSALFNALLAASLYTLCEMLLFGVFSGYYYPSLSHAVVQFPPALWYAGIGGAMLVSFLVAACNAMLAEALYGWQKGSYRACTCAAVFFAVVAGGAAAAYYLRPVAATGPTLSVSILQPAPDSISGLPLGLFQGGAFINPTLGSSIALAAQKSSLVIYPYSPVQGITYRGAPPAIAGVQKIPDNLIGAWLKTVAPASTTVMVWNTMSVGGALYEEYALWKGDEESEYRKRKLYTLSDYTPAWAQKLGLRRLPYAITPGAPDNRAEIDGVPIGALVCSELHQVELARQEASYPFIIAVGSDAMFPGGMAGDWSLAAARYRAAENGVFIVRGNVLGPSAFINQDGSIQGALAFGEPGVLSGSVPLQASPPTIYRRFGPAPLQFFIAISIAVALLARIYPLIVSRRR